MLQELQAQRVDWRFGMYIHFNMNTFYPGWANDRVDPKMFNPTKLDCTQWAAAAKSAGMKFAALTTKHHDGFALWPSKQAPPNGKAPYTIAQSSIPTRDVVREYVDAFRAAGIAPGLYFSMWDVANGIGGSYGTTDTINWDAVKGYVLGQLTELLSNYGEIPLLIFDGYSWKMGHKQIPYQEIRALVRKLQPACVITDHNGLLTEPWEQDLADFEEPLGIQVPTGNTYAAQQENTISGDWFWDSTAADSTKLKTVAFATEHLTRLEAAYCNFVLNCPPNRTGVFDQAIVTRLAEIGKAWSPNASRAPLPAQPPMIERPLTPRTATATSGTASLAIDGLNDSASGPRFQTLWQSSGALPQSVTLDLGTSYDGIDMLMYLPRREAGNTTGNITSYRLLSSTDGTTFTQVGSGTWPATAAVKRAQFPANSARYMRLEAVAVNGGANAVLGEVAVGSSKMPAIGGSGGGGGASAGSTGSGGGAGTAGAAGTGGSAGSGGSAGGNRGSAGFGGSTSAGGAGGTSGTGGSAAIAGRSGSTGTAGGAGTTDAGIGTSGTGGAAAGSGGMAATGGSSGGPGGAVGTGGVRDAAGSPGEKDGGAPNQTGASSSSGCACDAGGQRRIGNAEMLWLGLAIVGLAGRSRKRAR
jgi:alpha-L-fucosidase